MPRQRWAVNYRMHGVKMQSPRVAARKTAEGDAARLFALAGVTQVAVVSLVLVR
jgi:hypothetical protein